MQYKKITFEDNIIEFHNNWLGEETVVVNGSVVSKKKSVWGINHYFSIPHDQGTDNYILSSRISEGMMVVLDLTKNGALIHESIPVPWGSSSKSIINKDKKKGMEFLEKYDLDDAILKFDEALKALPRDPEIFFHKACIFSLQEKPDLAFEALEKAVKLGLKDHEAILTHDFLAFIRMDVRFESFVNNGFQS